MTPTDLAIFKVLIDKAIPNVVNGTDGERGKVGDTGLTGGTGEQGLRGKQGLSGKDAKAAVNGSQGARGFVGKDGKRGKDGTKGKSGGLGMSGPKGKDGGQGLKGRDGSIGLSGDKGRGVASIKVNSEDMLVITYDDGDLDIAGKMHFSKTSSGGDYYTGAPLGTFGIKGTKISPTGELIIVGPWGKEFNTGINSSSSGVAILDFGTGSNTAETIVTGIPSVNQNSVVTAQLKIESTLEHPVDDLLFDPIRVAVKSVQEGQGFTLFGIMDNSEANGTYKVQWALS